MAIKIFLGVIAVFALLGVIGANYKANKRIAAVIAIIVLIILAVVVLKGDSKEEKEEKQEVTQVAPDAGKITVGQNQWGTITVTDETGVTREYQGCIHIDGIYPYETYEFMGVCVSMDAAIEIGEWKPGLYRLYYEDEEAYWKMKKEQQEAEKQEKEKTQNE